MGREEIMKERMKKVQRKMGFARYRTMRIYSRQKDIEIYNYIISGK